MAQEQFARAGSNSDWLRDQNSSTCAARMLSGVVPSFSSDVANRRDGMAAGRASAITSAFALIGLPAAVLSRSRHLLAANDDLQRLIPTFVQDRRERIALTDRGADEHFMQALSAVARADGEEGHQIVGIKERDPHPAMLAHLFPIGERFGFGSEMSCLLIICPLKAQVHPAMEEILKTLFGLTRAEAKVAYGIATGSTVERLASEMQRSRGTIRMQLKSIFAKTSTHRQAQLAALLSGLALRPWNGARSFL